MPRKGQILSVRWACFYRSAAIKDQAGKKATAAPKVSFQALSRPQRYKDV